jgi:hypothetical protein
MSLAQRFQQTSDTYIINLDKLTQDQPYHIIRAERSDTRYGPAVLLTIRETVNSLKKVFLPRRYGAVITDDDISHINSGQKKVCLIYKGICPQTKGHLIDITGEE